MLSVKLGLDPSLRWDDNGSTTTIVILKRPSSSWTCFRIPLQPATTIHLHKLQLQS